MATDIDPSLGNAALFTQAGVPLGYDAIDLRRALGTGLQEGVIDSGSYDVTQRSEGANMSVDIAASTGEGAWIKGDSVTAQGLYFVPPHTAKINETITAADATNPRLDQVILEALDDTHAGGGLNKARVRVVAGTATSGATLDNRSGAAALPSSAIRLADVLVAAADTSITDAEIRDRRPWARGAYTRIQPSGGAYVGFTSATFSDLDATDLAPRIECSGVPVRCIVKTSWYHTTAGNRVGLQVVVDGAVPDANEWSGTRQASSGGAGNAASFEYVTEIIPSAGSHVFKVQGRSVDASATANIHSDALFIIEELVRQNVSNS